MSKTTINKDVVIIGAGASGVFCAIESAKRGRSVLVLDHADRICSKVLISGGGRCNFTNLNVDAQHYLSSNPHFCKSALARFTPSDFTAILKKYGIVFYEKEAGQLFCKKNSKEIVSLLKQEAEKANVQIELNCRITKVERKEHRFVLVAEEAIIQSESLVVATGGLSYPKLGASGFGHDIARQFGIPVKQPRPALVPFTFAAEDQKEFQNLSGLSFDAEIKCEGRVFRGNVLLTHRGLSGPAALQASSYWKPGTPVQIDLFPDRGLHELLWAERKSRAELKNVLSRYLPKRFAETWCDLYAESKPMVRYSDKELRGIVERLHAWEIRPAGTEGYSRAEATAGGVDTQALSSKTMESTGVPGLYFIGEVVDVTGHLGGYNLHWAWASGFAAGQFA